jgi:hypothetical protein
MERGEFGCPFTRKLKFALHLLGGNLAQVLVDDIADMIRTGRVG